MKEKENNNTNNTNSKDIYIYPIFFKSKERKCVLAFQNTYFYHFLQNTI